MDTTSENVSHNSFEDLSSEEYVFKISNIDELTEVDHRNDRSMQETFCSGKNFIDRIKSVKSRLQRIEHKKKIGRKSCLLSVTEADISSQQQYICSHNEHNENK